MKMLMFILAIVMVIFGEEVQPYWTARFINSRYQADLTYHDMRDFIGYATRSWSENNDTMFLDTVGDTIIATSVKTDTTTKKQKSGVMLILISEAVRKYSVSRGPDYFYGYWAETLAYVKVNLNKFGGKRLRMSATFTGWGLVGFAGMYGEGDQTDTIIYWTRNNNFYVKSDTSKNRNHMIYHCGVNEYAKPLLSQAYSYSGTYSDSVYFGCNGGKFGPDTVKTDIHRGNAYASADTSDNTLKPVIPPVDTVPVDTVPVDTVPVDTVPVDTIPVDTVPVDTVPVDTTVIDTVPIDTTPIPVGIRKFIPYQFRAVGGGYMYYDLRGRAVGFNKPKRLNMVLIKKALK